MPAHEYLRSRPNKKAVTDSGDLDATTFDALDQGLSRHPSPTSTGVDQTFSHQNLVFDAQTNHYQNRYREHGLITRRIMQRGPVARAVNNNDQNPGPSTGRPR